MLNDFAEQYNGLSTQTKLVVLHPQARRVHRFWRQLFLMQPRTVYVDLGQLDLKTGLALIAHALEAQLGVSVDLTADTRLAAVAISNALGDDTVLYLESYDSQVAEVFHELIVEVVNQLVEGSRVVVGGRRLFLPLLEDLRGQVALIPIDPHRMWLDYANSDGRPILEVRAFGEGQVWVNGRLVREWEGGLPRSLFFYFVDKAMTTRDEIFQIFWSHLGIKEATNVFHVTKKKISDILDDLKLTVYGGGFYRIASDIDLYYDVVQFQEALQNAAVLDDDEAEVLYRMALNLYREEFLRPSDMEWGIQRREKMRSDYIDAIYALGRIYENRGDFPRALGMYMRGAGISPTREDLTRGVMMIYDKLGQAQRVVETYDRLKETLRRVYNLTPDPQTTDLLHQMLGKYKK
ncbi:MAG: hypothetical protein H6673_02430 [Anaerolineales bacterium]|nr:hypothetical protein [Anaerolineales bacterium]